MKFLRLIAIVLTLTLSCGCSNKHSDAIAVLEALSEGRPHPEFASAPGAAIEILRKHRSLAGHPLHFDMRNGDAPDPIGDKSCQLHTLVSVEATAQPFIGIRLRSEGDGWHIAGYWTP